MPRTRSPGRRLVLATTVALAVLAAGCSGGGGGGGSEGTGKPTPAASSSGSGAPSSAPSGSASSGPTGPSGWGPSLSEIARARTITRRMTRAEKIGALLMPQFSGRSATKVTADEAQANQASFGARTPADAVLKYHLGGVILMGQNVSDARQVRRLNDGLAAAAAKDTKADGGLPLLIGTDQEGGVVQRVKAGATVFPSAQAIGRTGKPALAKRLARDNGRELRAMGFTLDFAPDADVGFDSPAIGTRSFAADPQAAATMVTASVEGFRAAGVVPVVKHFPGHGSAQTDSHTSLPVITRSKAQLSKVDLVPFRAALKHQVPAVLNAHLDVRAYDPGTPSSISKPVVTGLLRDDLGFRGVAFTDSDLMEPIAAKYGPGEAAVRAVLAGEDVILMPKSVREAAAGLRKAVSSGRISAKRLDASVTRVVALRLYAKRIGADRPPFGVVGSKAHARDVARVG